MTALSKRLVACKHFRWMPGMCGHDRYVFFRVVERFHEGFLVRFRNPPSRQHKEHRFWDDSALNPPIAPDLSDPGTLGCLLALVREAWDDPHVYVLACASDWFTVCSPNAKGGKWLAIPPIDGKSEAEALVAALEAAP